jgi:hypothetical protein
MEEDQEQMEVEIWVSFANDEIQIAERTDERETFGWGRQVLLN